jgi:hypothetical protein
LIKPFSGYSMTREPNFVGQRTGSRTKMLPALGPTTRPRGRIRKAGRRQRPTCASAIGAGGVDPIINDLRPPKDISAGSPPQLGSARIDGTEGLRECRAKCASVHGVTLHARVARPKAHGAIWPSPGAGIQEPPDHLPMQWLSLANATRGFGLPSRLAREFHRKVWDHDFRLQNLIHSTGGRRWKGP